MKRASIFDIEQKAYPECLIQTGAFVLHDQSTKDLTIGQPRQFCATFILRLNREFQFKRNSAWNQQNKQNLKGDKRHTNGYELFKGVMATAKENCCLCICQKNINKDCLLQGRKVVPIILCKESSTMQFYKLFRS